MRLYLFLWIGIAMVGQTSSAWAQRSTDADDESTESRAMELFNEATRFFSEENYEAASTTFREAYKLRPSWKLLYNIGQAESAASHFGRALVAFELYVAEGGDEVPEDRVNEVLEEIKRLRIMVGSVEVKAPDGAQILIDGVYIGTAPLDGATKIAAGKPHIVKIVLNDEILLEKSVRLSSGDSVTVTAEPSQTTLPAASNTAAVDAPPPPPLVQPKPEPQIEPSVGVAAKSPSPVKKPSTALKTAGIVLLGWGAAMGVAGGILGGMAVSKANRLNTLCDSQNVCRSSEATGSYDDSISYGVGSTVLLSTGISLGVTGLVLLIVHRKRRERLSDVQTRLRIVPSETGASLVGIF